MENSDAKDVVTELSMNVAMALAYRDDKIERLTSIIRTTKKEIDEILSGNLATPDLMILAGWLGEKLKQADSKVSTVAEEVREALRKVDASEGCRSWRDDAAHRLDVMIGPNPGEAVSINRDPLPYWKNTALSNSGEIMRRSEISGPVTIDNREAKTDGESVSSWGLYPVASSVTGAAIAAPQICVCRTFSGVNEFTDEPKCAECGGGYPVEAAQ